ncbi:D-lactate dehydrogenase [Streptococcus pyogenes]|nr:D-lactate dehydrogenase [Streptococcus pyogenes]VGV32688.1 D-lactate dehydrogenase [Streptococcus pyogenes]VHC00151.1 D-lactate dehydrogenase [Streptococcus pyogenes]VHM05161.1 D-lactate dehydrogenase [Streptococcus pyogenes]
MQYYTDEAVKNLVEGALNATVEIIKTGTTTTRVN